LHILMYGMYGFYKMKPRRGKILRTPSPLVL